MFVCFTLYVIADGFLELHGFEEQRARMVISDEGTIREYYDIRSQLDQFSDDVRAVTNHPQYSVAFLTPGRVIHVKHKGVDFGWGIVINNKRRKPSKNLTEEFTPHQSWVVDVLLKVSDGSSVGTKTFEDLPAGVRPPQEGEGFHMAVVPLVLNCIEAIGHPKLHLPSDLTTASSRDGIGKKLAEVQRRFPDGFAVLDPLEDMNIKDDDFKRLLRVSDTCGKWQAER